MSTTSTTTTRGESPWNFFTKLRSKNQQQSPSSSSSVVAPGAAGNDTEDESTITQPILNQQEEIEKEMLMAEQQQTTLHESSQQKEENKMFEAGDHVYIRCQKGIYCHHGIVVKVNQQDESFIIVDFATHRQSMNTSGGDNNGSTAVSSNIVVDSGDWVAQGKSKLFVPSSQQQREQEETVNDDDDNDAIPPPPVTNIVFKDEDRPDGMRFIYVDANDNPWEKVQYEASHWQQAKSFPGTCHTTKPDPVDLVIARTHFLVMNYQVLPSYDVVLSNCEAAAVWCKTGVWDVHQIRTLLDLGVTTSVAATTATTTTAALLANPILWPALAAGTAALGGVAIWNAISTRQQWRSTSKGLNTEFGRVWTEWNKASKMRNHDAISREDWKSMSLMDNLFIGNNNNNMEQHEKTQNTNNNLWNWNRKPKEEEIEIPKRIMPTMARQESLATASRQSSSSVAQEEQEELLNMQAIASLDGLKIESDWVSL